EMRRKRRDDVDLLLGARDGDVEAALAAALAKRTKTGGDVGLGSPCLEFALGLGVAKREDDDVTLVTLDLFEVLDERPLVEVRMGERRVPRGCKALGGAAARVDAIEDR